jgi:hypothetical protein
MQAVLQMLPPAAAGSGEWTFFREAALRCSEVATFPMFHEIRDDSSGALGREASSAIGKELKIMPN